MDKDTIISALKTHIIESEWDLNDWERIYERREQYSDDIYIFKCSFCDIYLYSDGSFYTADPNIAPSWGTKVRTSFDDDEKKIIDSLKTCLQPTDWDLNDWKTILTRAEKVDDNVTVYKISFCNIFLDENNNFYDAEPVEIDGDTNILKSDLNYEESLKVDAIKQYVLPKHYDLINWKYVFKNVSQVRENVYKYPLGIMDLYLNENLEIQNYDRCHIINEDEFWYDFNKHPITAGEQYTFITKI